MAETAFVITKIKEDGTDARPILLSGEALSRLLESSTLYKQSTFKIERIE
jgi:hypothetical protein